MNDEVLLGYSCVQSVGIQECRLDITQKVTMTPKEDKLHDSLYNFISQGSATQENVP